MFELACATVFPGAMAFAGAMDMLTMTIPNRISIALVIGFYIVALLAGLDAQAIALHTAVGLTVLCAGIFLFSCGWIGGGDAKIFAAASLWFGFDMLGQFAIATAVFGGALTGLILAIRIMPLPQFLTRISWIDRLHRPEVGIPYGIAIAAAALLLYPSISWIG